MLHHDISATDGIHIIYAWEVADNAALVALAVTALDEGKVARRLDNGHFYILRNHTGPIWSDIATPADTDSLSEGIVNLYFTAARVRATVLTGLSLAAGTVVAATHTVLQAIGFLQKQVSDNTTNITTNTNNITTNTSDIATLNTRRKEFLPIAAGDETTAITTGVKVTFASPPYAMTMNQVTAHLTTAQTSGSIFTADVKLAGSTIFSTLPTIDNTEKDTATAATASVLSTTAIPASSEITIEVPQIGDGTAKGLKVNLIWSKT